MREGAEVSIRQFGTSAEVCPDTLAPSRIYRNDWVLKCPGAEVSGHFISTPVILVAACKSALNTCSK